MNIEQLIDSITPEIYDNLKRAVELGKWPDGKALTDAQKESSLQAIIAYDARHKSEEERVGYIHSKKHTHCGSDGQEDPLAAIEDNSPRPLNWQE
jgi:uncharacterized protein YeaC (DUF1315 family)